MTAFERLDARLLPGIARPVGRAAGRMRRWRAGLVALPRDGRVFAALDARFATDGVLGFVRDVPQVGLVAVLALMVAGTFGVVQVAENRQASSSGTVPVTLTAPRTCPVGVAAGGTAYVGPAPTDTVPAYLAMRSGLLAECASAVPGDRFLAVISLRRAIGAASLPSVTATTQVLSLFADLPTEPSTPRIVPLLGAGAHGPALAAAARTALLIAAEAFLADAALQQSQANSITSQDPVQQAGKADFAGAARADRSAADSLQGGCACVYAALVEGTTRQLAALAGPQVRLVDLAPAGAQPAGVTARPLLPTEVLRLGLAADPAPVVAGSL